MTVFKVGPYVGAAAAASTRTRLHARRVKRTTTGLFRVRNEILPGNPGRDDGTGRAG